MATEKLEMLVLKTLDLTPMHGYGIGQRIEQISEGVFTVTLGSLYPALQRLEREGLITANGGNRTTTAGRATTGSPRRGKSGWARNRKSGNGLPLPWPRS